MKMNEIKRCAWAGSLPHMVAYHDEEWGLPLHDDRLLFEFLVLEGAQAGLSWNTILFKRPNYRLAFNGFDPNIVAGYSDARLDELMQNQGIVRNRLKITSARTNARCFVHIQEEFGSFDRYIWQFVDGTPLVNNVTSISQIPANSPESDCMSKDLKKRGLSFVGTTICYAFMQATGMVNDHVVSCFRFHEVSRS